MARKGLFADLSGLQLVTGALAAMTSAWLASWLGVAGTLIGAAVGSVVAAIASTLYSTSLRRGIQRSRTLLVTEHGSVVERQGDRPETTVVEAEVAEQRTDGWSDRMARLNWKRVALVSGAMLLIAVVVIGAYEVVSGRSFGNASNTPIAPISGSQSPAPQDPVTPSPGPTEPEPSQQTPGESGPTLSETPSPEPTAEEPTTGEPTATFGESPTAP